MDEPEAPTPENSPPEPPPIVPGLRPVVRRRPSSEPTAPGGDDAEGFITFLGGLYSQAKGGGAGVEPAAPGSTPERTQTVLQAKRLPRTGGSVASSTGGETALAETVARGEVSSPSTPVLGVMTPRAIRPPRRNPWSRVFAWSAVGCLVLGVAAAAWLWREAQSAPGNQTAGRTLSPSGPTRSVGSARVSDAALQVADQALKTIGKGDLARASEILAAAKNRQIVLPGLLYQSALLAYRQGKEEQADTLLDASINANEAVPECEYLHAAEAAARGDYRAAAEKMAEAVRFAAFSPRYYFYWAECLRRQGKPSEAIIQFQQAMQRHPSTADAELINFKLNLAKIEAGNDAGFQAELAAKLKEENVSATLLLIGAANEINRSAYAAATPYLRKAAQAMPPPVLQLQMRDYLFRLPDGEKERAAEWTALTPRPVTTAVDPASTKANAVLVDPATRGLAESDPAIW